MKASMWLPVLSGFVVLLSSGSAQGVKIEFDNASSTGSVSIAVSVYAGASPDSDACEYGGTSYSNGVSAYASYEEASAIATSSVVSSPSDAYPEPGGDPLDQAAILDLRFYQNCQATPYGTIPAGFSSTLDVTGTGYWKIVPSSQDETIGMPIVVAFAGIHSVGATTSNDVTYEMGIYEEEFGIEPDIFGPYECILRRPGTDSINLPDYPNLDVAAHIGDTIMLSYHIQVNGYTSGPYQYSAYGQSDAPSIRFAYFIGIEHDSKPLTVEIVGPSSAVVSNLTDRKTRVRPPSLEAVVTSGVRFKGGKYEWTILSGEDKVQLMGDAWDNRIVKVQPIKESSTLNDVMIGASYTVGGQTSYGDHFMTVLKPIALELLWEETKTKLNKDRQIIDYATTYWYRAIDQLVQPISVEGMYVREALELLPGYTYDPGKVKEWTDYTDPSGIFRDCLEPDIPRNLFGQPKGAIPLDYYVSLKQTIFVEGWDVATRRLTYHYNKATSEPWIQP